MNNSVAPSGLLGDTAARDYSGKLKLFNAFAKPELCQSIAYLEPKPGMRVLDAGCGTGEVLDWLSATVQPEGMAIGIDLAAAHVAAARAVASRGTLLVQADLLMAPLAHASFDLIWSANVINHLRVPSVGVEALISLLRPGGSIALGQSSLLPDMYFAWDARLERVLNEAIRQYYRDRYQVNERELTAARANVGLLRRSGLRNLRARTIMIERMTPLRDEDKSYLVDVIFRHAWGPRLQPYMSSDDYDELSRLCDPLHPDFALNRPDFHFLQTFTLVVGER
ncbi:class I SAM-dependent methyltransferase [Dyella flagellata]|uniref:Methyltransferase type 11 domain-containing protein n=1 Tax=Dyella flagellata TaxID=1867833 RepID=A0ABQ5X9V2_9GAMM|nr:class I SAM-dependent methyltransferase [Dyella flagellata]GLQ87677.1 hypothetical protein GCM10007898_12440 [Dyella flagellata]